MSSPLSSALDFLPNPLRTFAKWEQLLQKRQSITQQNTTFYRALHTHETQGIFSLERLECSESAENVGVLNLYRELSATEEQQLAQACAAWADLQSIYLKRRPAEARHLANVARAQLSPPLPILGTPRPEMIVTEEGVPFLMRPAQDLSIGLFSDARPARRFVRRHATGKRVLNLFAYTCGFGVNASVAGASVVKNVDLSQKVLAWGQENYALSGLAAPDSDFLYGDVFEWLSRLKKRGDVFDLVVLDPPSFARRNDRKGRAKKGLPKKVWRAEKDYHLLISAVSEITAPHGQLLCLLNHAGIDAWQFGRQIQKGLDHVQRRGKCQHHIPLDADYPSYPSDPASHNSAEHAHLKMQVWQLD